MSWIVASIAIAVLAVAYILLRNSLHASEQRVNSGWSGIEVQLKRRHELVPGLVRAAGAAMTHEKGIIDRIAAAREAALAAMERHNVDEMIEAEARLTSSLHGFFAYAEDNPQITATGNIATLQRQIEETEDQIAASRRLYNGNVEAYNIRVLSIPWSWVAALHGFATKPMVELSAAEKDDVYKPVEINLPG